MASRATSKPRQVTDLASWSKWTAYWARVGFSGLWVPCPWTGCIHANHEDCEASACFAYGRRNARAHSRGIVIVTFHCYALARNGARPAGSGRCRNSRCACFVGGELAAG